MNIRLEVKTPRGQAAGAEKKLRLVLLGVLKRPCDTYVSPDDAMFYWDLDVTVKDYMRITKNVARFQTGMEKALDIRTIRKTLTHLADKPEDIATLKEYLANGTTVRVLKKAETDEIVEYNKTFWQRIKEKFHHEQVKP
jgi:myo-inositol-1-phosphate synthase